MFYLFKDMDSRLKKSSKDSTYFNDDTKIAVTHHMEDAKHTENYQKNIILLTNIIEYSKQNGHKPVLIMTPVTEKYYSNITQEIKDLVFTTIKSLSKKTNVPFLNYSQDLRFKNNNAYFMNSTHLNDFGAKLFTQIVISEFKKVYRNK